MFVDRFYQRFTLGDSTPLSVETEKKEAIEDSIRSSRKIIEKNGSCSGKGNAKDAAANEKMNEKPKDHVDSSSSSANVTNYPRLIRLRMKRRPPNREDSIEMPVESDDPEKIIVPAPIAQRRTMSRRKFEAVAASIALKTRNELEEKRHKAYGKALGSLRMGFVECGNTGLGDDDSPDEDLKTFLHDGGGNTERMVREQEQDWLHSFQPKQRKKKKKKSKKHTKQNVENSVMNGKPFEPPPLAEHLRLNTIKYLHRQYVSFAKNIPISPAGSIFVRVPEQRLDLPRVLITGPHGTPYANGLFFFDIWAKDYPISPPKVRFLTTGNGSVRFNPNLYHSGKVCLSLLGTWQGPGWDPEKSTLLQVLLSCQGLIFGTDEPIYNEPGYASYRGCPRYKRESNRYNKEIRKQTLRWGILDPLRKIVLEEERIDTRKHFLEKLKEQRQQEKALQKSTVGDGNQGDDSSSDLVASAISKSNHERANAEMGSTKKEKKPKWKSISNLWTGTPKPLSSSPSNDEEFNTEDWEETKLLLSHPPPKLTYEYSEFSDVVIQHFLQTADYIEEQLESWHELDPRGTKYYVDEIRKWQKRLRVLVETRERLQKHTDEEENDDRGVKNC